MSSVVVSQALQFQNGAYLLPENAREQVRYSRALITHVDILGFAALIQDSVEHEETVSKVRSVLSNVKDELSAGGRIHRDQQGRKQRIFHAYNFSDLTVRCTVMPDGANTGDFLNLELLQVGEKQLSLACEGILVRGGLCIGDVNADDEIVFGPGIVRAYRLEREQAVYPRIVLDREMIRLTDQPGSDRYWRDFVRQGEDGVYFLDYLFGSVINGFLWSHPERPNPVSPLELHRDKITELLQSKAADERIRQKHIWLGRYHNDAANRLKNRVTEIGRTDIDFDQFLVPSTLLDY